MIFNLSTIGRGYYQFQLLYPLSCKLWSGLLISCSQMYSTMASLIWDTLGNAPHSSSGTKGKNSIPRRASLLRVMHIPDIWRGKCSTLNLMSSHTLLMKLCSQVQAVKIADTLSILPPILLLKIQNLFTILPNAISTKIQSCDK